MLDEEQREGEKGLLTWRTFGVALGLHVALFLVLWAIGAAFTRSPDVIIPIDMTIVPPWAEQTDDPEPDPLPPPKPEPEQPKAKPKPPEPKPPEPKPEPKPEPPKLEETKQDAVVKEKPKPPKKKTERGDFLKDAKKITTPPKKEPKKEPEKKPDFKKDAKLVKASPMKRTGKATAAEKPLSAEEFTRKMNEGYKIGARNQLAPNEESRCASLVAAALKRHWVEEFHWKEGMQPVLLELTFGPGGSLRRYRIVQSSGDAQVDRSVLAAAKATGSVPGLTPDFVRKYSGTPFVLAMKPIRH